MAIFVIGVGCLFLFPDGKVSLMNRNVLPALIFCCATLLTTTTAEAQFFFTGGVDNDFFNELNWTANSDGTGANPVGDPIMDAAANAIDLTLIVDGDSVVADGQVDIGSGSLILQSGSRFEITGAGNDLDINSASLFVLTDADLVVDDIVNFEGNSIFLGGSVASVTDDIAFQNNFVNLTINGTTFTSADRGPTTNGPGLYAKRPIPRFLRGF